MRDTTTEGPGTILGGLPVIAIVASGKDEDTPNGPGEYWAEVQAIHWRKRDGSKGGVIPQHIAERARKYDYHFCDLSEQIFDHVHYERWLAKQAAQGIAARSDETLQAAQPVGQEPGGDSHASNPGPLTNQDGGEKL